MENAWASSAIGYHVPRRCPRGLTLAYTCFCSTLRPLGSGYKIQILKLAAKRPLIKGVPVMPVHLMAPRVVSRPGAENASEILFGMVPSCDFKGAKA